MYPTLKTLHQTKQFSNSRSNPIGQKKIHKIEILFNLKIKENIFWMLSPLLFSLTN